ncbi:similar to Saccharomyces cerevisiae YGR250C Putative RNA binding protein [Maudiozyma saulgeensis]|uniref:Similar to Saccharomyces cerevisiae YGR250C Putative RNA binding protein n=1 Tax=Maudiozyma saulgeensis TaxID=1789683 RepID=A0A1X7R9P0_9SACH|nr:similar to Saccharomyces cerevisiae YGR250C Putative RNA binding protein [Kazachstania saulgeensis]
MSEIKEVSNVRNKMDKENIDLETHTNCTANSTSSAGLQLEQLANRNLLTLRIKWSDAITENEIEKDNIILKFSNYIANNRGSIINPLNIENYEYLCDSKRIEVIEESHYEFEHGSKEYAKSYSGSAKNWMFDIVHQAHFKKGYSLESCAAYTTKRLKELSDVIDRWSVTINHHALTHPGNLFIGGISKKITITKLLDILTQYGSLVSIKLIHDKVKDNNIGYGFVSYQLGSQASKCIQMLNGKEIKGSTLFINYHVDRKERENLHWNQIEENVDEKPFKCLFIGNLPRHTDVGDMVTEDMILDLLNKKMLEKLPNFTILSYYFPKGSNKNKKEISEPTTLKGYGFIKLGDSDEIQHLIDEFNGFQWFGNVLVVNKAIQNRIQGSNQKGSVNKLDNNQVIKNENNNNHSKQHREKAVIASHGPNLFDQQIPQYFKSVYHNYYNNLLGNQTSSNMLIQTPILGDTNSSAINYPFNLNNEPIYRASALPPNPCINGLPIPLSNQQESNLYVKHIPLDWTDETLSEFYECFGKIVSSKVITIGGSLNPNNLNDVISSTENDNTSEEEHGPEEAIGSSKGYGFVCFENPIDASRAIFATNGYQLNNGSILLVSFANKKGNNNASNNMRTVNHRKINTDYNNSNRNTNTTDRDCRLEKFYFRSRESVSTDEMNNKLPYNKKFMNTLMQQQNQLFLSSPMNMPQAPIQNFPMYMNPTVNNISYLPISTYNSTPFQYPRQT